MRQNEGRSIPCPICKASIPDLRPQLSLVCDSCGWEDAPKRRWLSRSRLIILVALTIIFGVAIQQHMSWQGFAVEAWFLRAKAALKLASVEDFGELGRICNTVHRADCSIYAYGEIVKQEPRNTIALGNLAMAQTEARRYQDALLTYDVFFKLGGSALDVVYWYARTLKEVGRASDAIPWY